MEATGVDTDLQALRSGDERAFEELVHRYHGPLLRLAMAQLRDRELAEDAVQEAWLQAIRGLSRFEGRSSFKTWLFGILLNVARARRRRESRLRSFTSLLRRGDPEGGPAVDPDRFNREGMWTSLPSNWSSLPEERLLGREVAERAGAAIQALPEGQREVILLRDLAGWGSEEVSQLLGISPVSQRVRLHRARSRVRQALEEYLR